MADILERLACADSDDLCSDAAAEIRRLRAALKEVREAINNYEKCGLGSTDFGGLVFSINAMLKE